MDILLNKVDLLPSHTSDLNSITLGFKSIHSDVVSIWDLVSVTFKVSLKWTDFIIAASLKSGIYRRRRRLLTVEGEGRGGGGRSRRVSSFSFLPRDL